MEQEEQDIFETEVGNLEPEKKTLSEAIITIVGYTKKTEKSNGEKMKTPLVEILCKHPNKPEEPIKISKIKTLPSDQVVTRSLWVQLDKENKIQKSSAIDDLLKYHQVDTIKELVGKTMDTSLENKESNFLCLKAY